MDFTLFFATDTYSFVILPFLIFIARVVDVSLGTIRIILVSKGFKYVAPLFGFFEVLIWILAIGQIMQNLTNFILYFAYAGGFAMGTFVGIVLENKLSLGMVIIRIITKRDASELIEVLKFKHIGVTVVDAESHNGKVKIIFTIISRHDLREAVKIIKKFNPHAFYTIEDVRFVSEGIFPPKEPWRKKIHLDRIGLTRKGK